MAYSSPKGTGRISLAVDDLAIAVWIKIHVVMDKGGV